MLLKKFLIVIGTVNRFMANDAILVLSLIQVMRPGSIRVALQAKYAHRASHQQARIRRTVRLMTRRTAAYPRGQVLEDKRPPLFGMAAHAGFVVLLCAAPAGQESRVFAMAIGARQQPFIDTMMERHRESRPFFPVALQAQCRGGAAFQIFPRAHGMKVLAVFAGVALVASNFIFPVLGSDEIRLAGLLVMAGKASVGSLQGRFSLEGQDVLLFRIVGMSIAGSMAGFATLALGWFFGFSFHRCSVHAAFEPFSLIFVASAAGFTAGKSGRLGSFLGWSCRRFFLSQCGCSEKDGRSRDER
jgi:hypothetical protein